MEWVANIDSSWLEVLKELINDFEESWTVVYLTSIRVKVLHKLYKVWFIKKFWKKHIFIRIEDAINHIQKKDGEKTKTKILKSYHPDKTINKNKKLEKYILKKYMRE